VNFKGAIRNFAHLKIFPNIVRPLKHGIALFGNLICIYCVEEILKKIGAHQW